MPQAYLSSMNLSQVQSTLSADSLNNDMLATTVRVMGTKWIIHCVPETEIHLKFIETFPINLNSFCDLYT